MDTDTITEPSGTCRCVVEANRTEIRTYTVAPRDGGGWPVTIEVFGADSPCEACFWAA